MYREITYKAGATKEIIRYYPKGTRKGITRGPIRKKTREEIREANRRMAQRELERIMNANFRPGDWHVTLTYRKELRPTPEEARDTLKKFLGKLRRRYRKNGFELKYIVATEYLSKHIHHHLVVNAVNTGKETTADMIRELWTDRSTGGIRGNPKFVQLYDNGEYSQLASYLIKETDRTFRSEGSAVGQRYSCSRNLVHPQKQVKDKPNKTWKKEPQPISHEDYERLIKYLEKKNPPAILPIQIAYYAGLRIGETCGLTWQDINLEEQCLTIKRSIRYDGMKHKNIIGPTKRKKVRIVDFGDTLTEILKAARKEQLKNRMQYGELYHRNYYKEVHVKNRVYYEYYHLDVTQEVPADYKEISFVCLRPDGSLELPSTLSIVCRSVSKKLEGFEDFHFHQLRHTYTSNLLSNGAAPKDVQELLGHSDVSTTMNIYAHSTRKAKRDSARLLDKVASNA